MTTEFDAANAENLVETYWRLLEAVPPTKLRLTKYIIKCKLENDEIYDNFMEQFPEYNADHSTIRVINEDVLKSEENKPRWNKFMNSYEKKVQEHNFGALVRKDANGEYNEQNTLFGPAPRMQFYVFEIARNRLGMNDHVYETAQAKKSS
ncbi:hypothetical protein FRC10_012242 [Ceratobasidium sp. 414]|nr:hypothetical protein FRC10_012242 [Ceratobasidium sp. 414]